MNIYAKVMQVITRINDETLLKIKVAVDKEIDKRSHAENKGKGAITDGKTKKEDS